MQFQAFWCALQLDTTRSYWSVYTFLTSPCVSHLNRQNASARYFFFFRRERRKRILTQQQQQQDSNEIIWQVVKGCAPESSQLFFPRFSYIYYAQSVAVALCIEMAQQAIRPFTEYIRSCSSQKRRRPN